MTNGKIQPTKGEKRKLETFFEIPTEDLFEEVDNG